MNYPHCLNIAIEAAKAAGDNIKRLWHAERNIEIKEDESLLTQIDTQNEAILREFFAKNTTEIPFWGEESGVHATLNLDVDPYWCVDPVDGTTNLAHSFPFICVSIALIVEGQPRVGVVYNPMQDQLFSAAENEGAKLNGKRIGVSTETDFQRTLLATGFPVGPFPEGASVPNIKNFTNVSLACHSVRRPGSAALDMAFVAAGMFDGFWEIGLKAWDTPAGCILVREAGGTVTGFEGDAYNPHTPYVIASNGKIHETLAALVRKDG